MTPSPTLAEALARGRRNNLDLVRLAAALAVVVSHAWPLALGAGAAEPLSRTLGLSLGGAAVLLFFFVSGLLIADSAHRTAGRPLAFIAARAGRILPGLFVALVVTAGVAALTGAGFGAGEAAAYVLRGLSLASLQHELTGAFAANPLPYKVNGPLWTLFYEVLCYAVIAAAAWSGLLRRRLGWVALVGSAGALWAGFGPVGTEAEGALAYRLSVMAPLALAFALGAAAWGARRALRVDWRLGLALGALAWAAHGSAFFLPVFVAALGFAALLAAYRLPVRRPGGDISYGVYIYGWPVAQAAVAVLGPVPPLTLAAVSAVAVLPFALLSWRLVEAPALGLAARIARGAAPARAVAA